MAIINGLKHSFNQDKQSARKKWIWSSINRHPASSTRIPEGTYVVRVKSYTAENVGKQSEVNNFLKKGPSRNSKVENKGHAVIQRGKINLKLVNLVMS